MNDYIKKLAEANGFIHDNMTIGEKSDALKKFEKTSEVILQECINTVQKRYMGDNNREDMEVLRCVSELKNHFGVE
jgi:hypothetical protein